MLGHDPWKGVGFQPTLAERVCKTLEGITTLTDDETEFGSMVYKFCHIASGTCGNPHEDWVAEFEKVEADINRSSASPLAKQWKKRQSHEEETRIREQ